MKYTLFLKEMITHQKDFNEQEDDEQSQNKKKEMHKIVEEHLLGLMKDEEVQPEEDKVPSCLKEESEDSQLEDDDEEDQDQQDDESELDEQEQIRGKQGDNKSQKRQKIDCQTDIESNKQFSILNEHSISDNNSKNGGENEYLENYKRLIAQ